MRMTKSDWYGLAMCAAFFLLLLQGALRAAS